MFINNYCLFYTYNITLTHRQGSRPDGTCYISMTVAVLQFDRESVTKTGSIFLIEHGTIEMCQIFF